MSNSPEMHGGEDANDKICPERVERLTTGDGREPLDPSVLIDALCVPGCPGPCEVPSLALLGLTRWTSRVSVGYAEMCPDELNALLKH